MRVDDPKIGTPAVASARVTIDRDVDGDRSRMEHMKRPEIERAPARSTRAGAEASATEAGMSPAILSEQFENCELRM
jgi:hypothetical protein